MLFKGHPELIVGFNTFLPPGYKIEVTTAEQGGQGSGLPGGHMLQSMFQTIVHTPHGTHMMGNHGIMGPVITTATSLQSLSSPVSVRPVTVHQAATTQPKFPSKPVAEPAVQHSPSPGAVAAPARPEPAVQQGYAASPPVMPVMPPTLSISNSGHVNSSAPAPNILNAINPNTLPTPAGQGQNSQPVEFNHAINYVNKIKNRFQGQPDVYKQFLEILHTYQKDQRAIKEGGAPKSMLTESEVYAQVSKLFQNQEDLLAEFGQFLPEATNDHSTAAIMVSSKGLANDHVPATAATKPRGGVKAGAGGGVSGKLEPRPQPDTLKRAGLQGGLTNRMAPPAKKPRLGVLKDVSLGEAQRYGTLNEFAFFDKVRKALKNSEVYENFLRCLVLFNQEIVSRSELVQLVNPFLNKNPELLKWFKDFIGFREGSGGLEQGPGLGTAESQRARHERVASDTAMEIGEWINMCRTHFSFSVEKDIDMKAKTTF